MNLERVVLLKEQECIISEKVLREFHTAYRFTNDNGKTLYLDKTVLDTFYAAMNSWKKN